MDRLSTYHSIINRLDLMNLQGFRLIMARLYGAGLVINLQSQGLLVTLSSRKVINKKSHKNLVSLRRRKRRKKKKKKSLQILSVRKKRILSPLNLKLEGTTLTL